MMDSGRMERQLGTEYSIISMEMCTRESLRMIKLMERELTPTRKDRGLKESGKMTLNTGLEKKLGKMVLFMKDSSMRE